MAETPTPAKEKLTPEEAKEVIQAIADIERAEAEKKEAAEKK